MAETLTVDTTPDTEVLTADEQESLEIGEQMQTAQDNLLAGKYKDAQELEKAYLELQTKLGESQSTTEDSPEEFEQEVEPPDASDILDRLWDEAQNETYSDDIVKEINDMSSSDLAQMHLQYRLNNQPQTLTDTQVGQLKNIVGGDAGYQDMMSWAKGALKSTEIDMYDAVMERGDPMSCFFAVEAMRYRMAEERGVEGKMLTGKAPSNSRDSFSSQAQVVEAMSDPKYDKDPAYRKEIMDKLERSDLQF